MLKGSYSSNKPIFNLKRLILFSFLIILAFTPLFSYDEETILLIFEKHEKGVAYIEQSIYLNSEYISNRVLIERLEEEYEMSLLDRYMTLSNGSGFFITDDGYLVTNFHVVDVSDVDKIKASLLERIDINFLSKIPEEILSEDDSNKVYIDFRKMFSYAKFEYRIIIGNKEIYKAELVHYEKNLDLALLKINTHSIKPLLLGDSDRLKIGNAIMSIGYPRISISFDTSLHYFPTMTTGNVSSIRNELWGIQHTSSINPGNSGGPLVNMKGEVVGVNVGTDQEANDVNFSIPMDVVVEWLEEKGMGSLITENKRVARGIGEKYTVNKFGHIETGPMVFIDLDPGYFVYLNGRRIGKTPILLRKLDQGINSLRLESNTEYLEQKFFVKDNIFAVFNYNPRLDKYKGSVYLNSYPQGADVKIDGKVVGETPVMLSYINSGKHRVQVRLDGHVIIEDEIIVPKKKLFEKKYKLEKGYKLIFPQKLPKDTFVEVRKDNIFYKYIVNDNLYLNSGIWQVRICSSILNEQIFDVIIQNKDKEVYIDLQYVQSIVVLNNIKYGSRIYLDGKEITPISESKSLTFQAEVGKRKIVVRKNQYKPIEMEVEVLKGEEINFDLEYIKDHRNLKFK